MLNVSEIRRKVSARPDATWVPGETPLTSLPDDLMASRLGLHVPPGELERIATALSASPSVRETAAFADASDWREKGGLNYVTGVRDQGACASSVAFATVATIESQARIEYRESSWDVDLSEADLFFGGAGLRCAEGWWPPEALKRAVNAGIPAESCFPYKDDDADYKGCSDRATKLLRIGEWRELLTPAQRKGWLHTNGPVISCLAVFEDFLAYTSGVYRQVTGQFVGYHAVSCVGYSEPEQAWICKNSWGQEWGEKGFFKIGYGQAEMDTRFSAWGVARVTGTLLPIVPDPRPKPEEATASVDRARTEVDVDFAYGLTERDVVDVSIAT